MATIENFEKCQERGMVAERQTASITEEADDDNSVDVYELLRLNKRDIEPGYRAKYIEFMVVSITRQLLAS